MAADWRPVTEPADVMGRWALVKWLQTYDDGRVTYPFGEAATGFIHYGRRYMNCLMARPQRSHFESGGQWNASAQEKAAAYDSFMSYCGTYEMEGDAIVHRVTSSLYPNWEGGAQKRRAQIRGDELRIVARLEEGTPNARTATLLWRRDGDEKET